VDPSSGAASRHEQTRWRPSEQRRFREHGVGDESAGCDLGVGLVTLREQTLALLATVSACRRAAGGVGDVRA
jgi:hypothetical protein